MVHRIRLRGAWRIERGADGSAVFERSFGSPRTLDAGETVWLTCKHVPGEGTVELNDRVVDRCAAGEYACEITREMQTRNVVRFALVDVGDSDLGDVALEFRASC